MDRVDLDRQQAAAASSLPGVLSLVAKLLAAVAVVVAAAVTYRHGFGWGAAALAATLLTAAGCATAGRMLYLLERVEWHSWRASHHVEDLRREVPAMRSEISELNTTLRHVARHPPDSSYDWRQ